MDDNTVMIAGGAGVRIVHGDQLDPNTPQTPGMQRAAAINYATAGPASSGRAVSRFIPTPRRAPTTTARWRASSTWSVATPVCAGASGWNTPPRLAPAT
ncbi:MAG TPA: hypothetical protein VFX31_00390, partial [Ktedonobacterales bacterium]|nr:hypothetical protein [Ktedonobacterales bacterium]